MRAFTSEEKLEEDYHCSHCKSKQPATKKLQIWKLPPILIVHLKRFNFVNNKWVKSQKVVNFPFKDFDPTPYLASLPQETILRHKELIEHGNTSVLTNGFLSSSNSSIDNDSSTGELTSEHSIMSDSIKEVDTVDIERTSNTNNKHHSNEITDVNHSLPHGMEKLVNGPIAGSTKANISNKMELSVGSKPSAHSSKRNNAINTANKMRKRLVSTSLIKSPIIDGAFVDYHKHNLDEDQDPFDLKYKLYAVVVS